MSAAGNENVGGLDVAVHDPAVVGRVQRIGNFDRHLQQRFDLHGPSRDAVLERHAIQELHGNEGLIFVLADLVNGADVGMVQGRGGARLAAETFERVRIVGDFAGKNFSATKRPNSVSSAL